VTAKAFVVDKSEAGQTLAAVLRKRLGLSWSQARRLVEVGEVRVGTTAAADAAARLRAGQRVQVGRAEKKRPRPASTAGREPAPSKPPRRGAEPAINVVHLDDVLIVVDKPPGLTTSRDAEEAAEFGARGRRFLPPTLADLLPKRLPGGGPVFAVHRLDRDTSGLVAFARTPEAATDLAGQFRAHTVERRYLALVRGRPASERIESVLVPDRGDGRRGSAPPGYAGSDGRRAVTHVRVVEELGPFALVGCRLETGRTHQVRIHLGENGAPLCGERVYDRPPHGRPVPDGSGAPRVALHAAVLGLRHPTTGETLRWESPLPDDLAAVRERLRGASGEVG
jgi:23S rRNA pseudouridine1911/1915/1917 synthase